MAKINPYLNFGGNAEEAFTFYKSVFGGEFMAVMRFKDMGNHGKVPAEDLNKIAHISLPIGAGTVLMASDALPSFGQTFDPGNNFYISVTADSKEEADRLYNALSAGGKIEMPIADAPWGSYFGQFMDKYRVQWMMSYEYPK